VPIPSWLPDTISCNGQWPDILGRLWAVFQRDFIEGSPHFKGLQVWWDRSRHEDDKDEGFWHITHRYDYQIGQRIFDQKRSQKITWCASVIKTCPNPDVIEFRYLESSGIPRTYLWVQEAQYAVVLEPQRRALGRIAMLITAYHVGSLGRDSLERKYDQRIR